MVASGRVGEWAGGRGKHCGVRTGSTEPVRTPQFLSSLARDGQAFPGPSGPSGSFESMPERAFFHSPRVKSGICCGAPFALMDR